jgi:purine-binding chemotaxis protein CheW
MSGTPALDDYFDALLGEGSNPAPPATLAAAAAAIVPAAPAQPTAVEAPAAEAAPTAPSVFAAPLGDPLDELEAVFEQAQAEARAGGVFDQATTAVTAAPAAFAAPLGDPLDELETLFEQTQAEARAAGVFDQAAAPAAEPARAPLQGGPSTNELDELEAAFEAAAAAARDARVAVPAAAAAVPAPTPEPVPSQVPLPGPAQTPPQHGLLKPQLVRRSEAIKRRLTRRREEGERTNQVPTERINRWLRFQMQGQSYAVELLKVQEVQRVPDIMPVRGAARHVIGVMNLRGQVIAVIDLGLCLGLALEPQTEASRVIVLETQEETVGLLVSAVAEVISLSERAIENPISSIPTLPREALIGMARHSGGMSVLLDATVFLK